MFSAELERLPSSPGNIRVPANSGSPCEQLGGWYGSRRSSAANAAAQGFPGTISAAAERLSTPGGRQPAGGLDSAAPGDAIELPAGATFIGNFVLPQKNGTAYITIRTAPRMISRSQRAGHPAHSGSWPDPIGQQRAALRTAPGARHWKLVLLEFGPNQAGAETSSCSATDPPQSNLDRVPSDLVVDRCYIHGDPARGQKRGIALNSASTTVGGSYPTSSPRARMRRRLPDGTGPGPS